jgi:hypothetical protein
VGHASSPLPTLLTWFTKEFKVILEFWSRYFPTESNPETEESDDRIQAIYEIARFLGGEGQCLIEHVDIHKAESVTLNFAEMCELCSSEFANNVKHSLVTAAETILLCFGLGLCIVRQTTWGPHMHTREGRRRKLEARFNTFEPTTPLSDLKSHNIHRFISISGTVVRASPIKVPPPRPHPVDNLKSSSSRHDAFLFYLLAFKLLPFQPSLHFVNS